MCSRDRAHQCIGRAGASPPELLDRLPRKESYKDFVKVGDFHRQMPIACPKFPFWGGIQAKLVWEPHSVIGPHRGPGTSHTFSRGTLSGPSRSVVPLCGMKTVLFELWTCACGSSPVGTSANSASARTSVGISVVATSGSASRFGWSPMMASILNHFPLARRQSLRWSARAGRRECPVPSVYIDAEVIPVLDQVSPWSTTKSVSRAREGRGRNR